MSNYKVEWVGEEKEITGKFGAFKKRTLTLEREGEVDLSDKHPMFNTVRPGDNIEGDITINGRYKTLYPPKGNLSKFGPKPEFVKQAQERTAAQVKVAQENRKEGVMIAGTMRDATQITLAELAGHPIVAQEFQERWVYWQKWLSEQWKTLELGF